MIVQKTDSRYLKIQFGWLSWENTTEIMPAGKETI